MSERILYLVEAEPRKKGLSAEFVGFKNGQEQKVKAYLQATRLPVEDLKLVAKEHAENNDRSTIAYCQPDEGKVAVLNNFDNIPPIGQAEALTHEQAHLVTPFLERNERHYGSAEAAEAARRHTIAVAKQSLMTKRYINPYQAGLARALENGEINEARFIEETSGIMIGLRLTNPKHLEQVDAAQKGQLAKIAPNAKAVDILTTDEQAKSGRISGVDITISSLIPDLKTKGAIDNHVRALKNRFYGNGNLNQGLPKAA